MKCLICRSDSCVCDKDVLLPTKSTLSPSVTEFNDPLRRKLQNEIVEKLQNREISTSRISKESLVPKFSFDSKKDKLVVPAINRNTEKTVKASSSFPSRIPKYQATPFLPFKDYIDVLKEESTDCATCSKDINRPPSEPKRAQQVKTFIVLSSKHPEQSKQTTLHNKRWKKLRECLRFWERTFLFSVRPQSSVESWTIKLSLLARIFVNESHQWLSVSKVIAKDKGIVYRKSSEKAVKKVKHWDKSREKNNCEEE